MSDDRDAAFTEPIEALRFLAKRFRHAGVGSAVAQSYADDLDAVLAGLVAPQLPELPESGSFRMFFDKRAFNDDDMRSYARSAVETAEAARAFEIAVLRKVYEAARRTLRFNGVDAEKARAAVDEMDAAIERVKLFDGGNYSEAER